MKFSSLSWSSSGITDSQDLVPGIENLTLSSTEKSSSSVCSVIDRVISDIDLLTLILICLPAKSLLVLKSVSKQWLSLISDPIFRITHHLRQNPKTTGLFFDTSPRYIDEDNYFESSYGFLLLDGSKYEQGYQGEEEEASNTTVTGGGGGFKIPRKFGDDPEPGKYGSVGEFRFRISQYCNGLLCCNRQTEINSKLTYYEDDPMPHSTYKNYIYNPTTREYRCLPPSPFRDNVMAERDDCYIEVCSISLAFDPLKSLDQHYQVICIFSRQDWDEGVHGKCYIEIYSSKTNSWRKLNSFYPIRGHSCMLSWFVLYWNGCLHWVSDYDHSDEPSMFFDIEQELVKPLPATPNGNDPSDRLNVIYFGVCGGHLYLIELESCHTHFNILKMEIDYSGWKCISRLDLDRLVALYPTESRLSFMFNVVLFLEEDEAESLSKLVVAVSYGGKVVSFDLKEMSATEIHTFTKRYSYLQNIVTGSRMGNVHHYVESLACV